MTYLKNPALSLLENFTPQVLINDIYFLKYF